MHDKYGGWNSHSLVIHVLRNSVYIGKVKFKGKTYDGVHQPILSESVFTRAQELMLASSREDGKTSPQKTPFRAGYLLSGLVYCRKCGARYSANHGFYKCYSRAKSDRKYIVDPDCKNKNWPINELDTLVTSEIEKLKYDSDYLSKVIKDKTNDVPKLNNAAVTSRIKELDKQMNRMIGLYQIGSIPMEQISDRVENLQKEKHTLQLQLSGQAENSNDNVRRFIEVLNRFGEVFANGTIEEKRVFISSLIESIWIDEEDVRIKWRI